jgi:MFS family permease
VCHLGLLVFPGILLTLRAEFGLSEQFAANLSLAGYMLLGFGAIPAGIITDRSRPQRMLVVFFLWTAAACGIIAAARNPWLLAGGLTLLGAGASLYHPVGLTMISHGVRERGKAMGIHGVAGSVGVSLGPPLGMWMAAAGSWRLAYVVVGGVALVAAFAVSRVTFRDDVVDRSAIDGAGAEGDGEGPLARSLPLLYGAMVCGGLSYRAMITVLPAFLLGGAASMAGLQKGGAATLAVLAVGGVGQLVGGQLSDRVSGARLYVVLVAVSAVPALAIGLGFASARVAVAAVLVFFVFSVQPVENNLLARASPSRYRATLYGLKFAPAFGIGALATPVVGWVWAATGRMTGVFLFQAALLALMAVLAGTVAVRAHRRVAPAPASKEV